MIVQFIVNSILKYPKFYAFVTHRTVEDEMQDFFLEKDFIFTLFLAVKFTESDTKAFFVAKTKENLFALASFDVIGRNFNNQKKHKDKLFLQENIYYT